MKIDVLQSELWHQAHELQAMGVQLPEFNSKPSDSIVAQTESGEQHHLIAKDIKNHFLLRDWLVEWRDDPAAKVTDGYCFSLCLYANIGPRIVGSAAEAPYTCLIATTSRSIRMPNSH